MDQLHELFPTKSEDELIQALMAANFDIDQAIAMLMSTNEAVPMEPDEVRAADESKDDQLVDTGAIMPIMSHATQSRYLINLPANLVYRGSWQECKRAARAAGRTIIVLFSDPDNFAVHHFLRMLSNPQMNELIANQFQLFIVEYDDNPLKPAPDLMNWYYVNKISRALFAHPITAAYCGEIELESFQKIRHITIDDWIDRFTTYMPDVIKPTLKLTY